MSIIEAPVEAPVEAPAKWVCPERTRELLLKVRDLILDDPKIFEMDSWGLDESCATTKCIAGWACLAAGRPLSLRRLTGDNIRRRACEVMGISEAQGRALFYAGACRFYAIAGWPEPFTSAYAAAKTKAVQAEVAAARIVHFIETGE